MSTPRLELESQHELNLARQSGTGVRRCRVVIIVVEVHGGVDQAEASRRRQDPLVGYRISRVIGRLRIVESYVVWIRIAILGVIEDVEYLSANLHRQAFCQPGFLGQRQVNLPNIQRPNQSVRSIAETADKTAGVDAIPARVSHSSWIERGRGEGRRIDRERVIVHASRKKYRNSRNKIRPLRGLIVSVW